MMYFRQLFALLFLFISLNNLTAQNNKKYNSFTPGQIWQDDRGKHINAHGGGILYHEGKYYWFGEHRPTSGFKTEEGITCYSSTDLYNWKYEGLALSVSSDESSPIIKGCIMERPKVIYNRKTKKFVMYFHLELKDRGYEAALVGVATSDHVTEPFTFVKASRVNADKFPLNMTEKQIKQPENPEDYKKWWTPRWFTAIKNGLFVHRDLKSGQMSRDMTLFVDDNQKAYHIYSSEDNLTLHVAELTDDYLDYTGNYIRIDPAGHNEAPAVFKKDGRYYMITSGCTGWDPNAGRLLVADHMLGTWKRYDNPFKGKDAEVSFHSQSTYILPIEGKKDTYIYMGDRWRPKSLQDSRYIWLPIMFENGLPVVRWVDEWKLEDYANILPDYNQPKEYDEWTLVWNDEFNHEGQVDLRTWSHEQGFVRNNEYQWYQAENTSCNNGVLTISGDKVHLKNPNFDPSSKDWRKSREYIEYTAASITTRESKEFLYGRFEIRAKIPVASGSWPAIWTLGNKMEWPSNGEIDIMEYYQINGVPHILANTAWGTDRRYTAAWNTQTVPFSKFLEKDPNWAAKFHIWRMDWDHDYIRIYLDDMLINETPLDKTFNKSLGDNKNPFRQPHYILLNLAIGGDNGGEPDDSAFPLKYEIDYVRVYQKTNPKK